MLLIGHLLKSLFRAFFKITLAALVTGGLAAEGALGLAYLYGFGWPPTRLIVILAIAIGVLGAYAAGLTTLLQEALRAALTVEHGVVRGVEEEIAGVGGKRRAVAARR
ncbi:MAG TPA: hypothetical protein VF808_19185 [Ktedonobacterales bacterium]